MNGVLTEEEFWNALKLAEKGIMEIYKAQKETLMNKYSRVKVEVEE